MQRLYKLLASTPVEFESLTAYTTIYKLAWRFRRFVSWPVIEFTVVKMLVIPGLTR